MVGGTDRTFRLFFLNGDRMMRNWTAERYFAFVQCIACLIKNTISVRKQYMVAVAAHHKQIGYFHHFSVFCITNSVFGIFNRPNICKLKYKNIIFLISVLLFNSRGNSFIQFLNSHTQ